MIRFRLRNWLHDNWPEMVAYIVIAAMVVGMGWVLLGE